MSRNKYSCDDSNLICQIGDLDISYREKYLWKSWCVSIVYGKWIRKEKSQYSCAIFYFVLLVFLSSGFTTFMLVFKHMIPDKYLNSGKILMHVLMQSFASAKSVCLLLHPVLTPFSTGLSKLEISLVRGEHLKLENQRTKRFISLS